ncbi:MAG TPA: type II toxin-antitoxin system Phd/YefM family antitoxin [Oceanipulchritudo sp.]|nr:type II toxin-antitoxin system Phd/YefM family antitoxin [Oceanipulchritudo sp.]
MDTVKLSEAKAHLGRYAREAAQGKRILITDRNRAMAVLSGVEPELCGIRPRVGLMDGKARIPEDFNAPLEGFEKDFYGS